MIPLQDEREPGARVNTAAAILRVQGPVSYAMRAARTARSMSSARPSATWVRTAPVAGLIVLNVAPETASTKRPLMKSLPGSTLARVGVSMSAIVHLAGIRRDRHASGDNRVA